VVPLVGRPHHGSDGKGQQRDHDQVHHGCSSLPGEMGYPLPRRRLEGAETNPARFLRTEFNVSEHVSRNQDHAAFLIGEPQLRTVSQGCRHQLGHLVSALSGLEDNLTADVLNTDPDFHPVSPSYAAAWSGHAGRAHRPFLKV
jgi:hypothetical protein